MDQEVYKKIEAYLGGNMTPEEIILFENEIEQNKSLKKELKLYEKLNLYLGNKDLNTTLIDSDYIQNIRKTLRDNDTEKIKSKLKSIGNQYHQQKRFSNKRMFFSISAVIVIFITTSVFLYKFDKTYTLDELYSEYYNVNDLPTLVNRSNSSSNVTKGINFFEDKKYQIALKVFKNYQDSIVQLDNQIQMYIGVSLLETGKNNKAIKAFDNVIESNELNSSKGLWFKAMVYMKNNNLEKTKLTLEAIIKNTNNFKYKEAKELLIKIN